MGNYLLTGGNARFYAGFNNLLVSKAKNYLNKINGLQNDSNTEKLFLLNILGARQEVYFVHKSVRRFQKFSIFFSFRLEIFTFKVGLQFSPF